MIQKIFLYFKKHLLVENLKIENLDSPETNEKIKKIINENYLLKNYYIDCYKIIKSELLKENKIKSKILEIGSGGGFIKDILPNVITSEIIKLKDIDLLVDALNLPFENNSLDVILMINVLHHVKDSKKFFFESNRVLKKNGLILFIEPANTWFSRIIYKNFHHEDFDENAGWSLNKSGRLSSANQAIPYIIFERDKKIFNKTFPNLEIIKKYKFKPLHYLLSGGLTYEILFNKKLTKLLLLIEKILVPFNRFIGLFMFVKLKKTK